jgi:hypothetical protein
MDSTGLAADMGGILAAAVADNAHQLNLTHREYAALLVLALGAFDASQTGRVPHIEAISGGGDKIRRRMNLSSERQRQRVLQGLVAKGALVRIERGRLGRAAVYAIAPALLPDGWVSRTVARVSETDGQQYPEPSGKDAQNRRPQRLENDSTSQRAGPVATVIRQALPAAGDDDIASIVRKISTEHKPRNLTAYTRTLAANGDLPAMLGCDTHGRGHYSSACRTGDSRDCLWSWCDCRCHRTGR